MQVLNKLLFEHQIIPLLLSLILKELFTFIVKQECADRYYKKLKKDDHFICMFYNVMTKNSSLRKVFKNIGVIITKLIPFGMKLLPARSPLSDANRKRIYRLFEQLYKELYSYYKTSLVGNWLDISGEVDPNRVDVFDSILK